MWHHLRRAPERTVQPWRARHAVPRHSTHGVSSVRAERQMAVALPDLPGMLGIGPTPRRRQDEQRRRQSRRKHTASITSAKRMTCCRLCMRQRLWQAAPNGMRDKCSDRCNGAAILPLWSAVGAPETSAASINNMILIVPGDGQTGGEKPAAMALSIPAVMSALTAIST